MGDPTFSPSVLGWWLSLSAISVFNIGTWWRFRGRFLRESPNVEERKRKLDRRELALCGCYAIICAFRSVLPRADVQRICLFDTFASSVFVGRSVATVAELCFVAQWALVVHALAKVHKATLPLIVSIIAVPMICVAECFSWYAVISTNYLGNVVEESIWGTTGAFLGVALAVLWSRAKGELKRALVAAIGCAASYVAFMSLVDVPMYFSRWQADQAGTRHYFTPREGLYDLTHHWVVTRAFEDWHEEIPWMTLYFSVAVWLSLALTRLPDEWFRQDAELSSS
jgi:hypothetical protein